MRPAVLTLALLLASAPSRAENAPPLKVFVLAPQVQADLGVETAVVEGVLTRRVARLDKLERLRFLNRKEVMEVIRAIGLKQLTGDDSDDDVLKKLGDAVNADRVIATVVGRVGSSTVVSVTLMDVGAGKAEKRIMRVVKGDAQFIITGLNEASDELLAHLVRRYGNLEGVAAKQRPRATIPSSAYASFAALGAGVGLGAGGAAWAAAGDLKGVGAAAVFAAAGVLAAGGVAGVLLSKPAEVAGDPSFMAAALPEPGGAVMAVAGRF